MLSLTTRSGGGKAMVGLWSDKMQNANASRYGKIGRGRSWLGYYLLHISSRSRREISALKSTWIKLPLKENHFCKGMSSWLLNISVCWCCLGNFENFPRQNFPEVWSTPGQKGSWSKDNKLSSQGHLLTTIIISFCFLITTLLLQCWMGWMVIIVQESFKASDKKYKCKWEEKEESIKSPVGSSSPRYKFSPEQKSSPSQLCWNKYFRNSFENYEVYLHKVLMKKV